MATDGQTVLFFAEDPGAVNIVAPVVGQLPAGMNASLLSAGHATELLERRGLRPTPVGSSAEAESALSEARPTWVLVGTSENPNSPGLALIRAARAAGCITVGLVDFSANAAFRFRGTTNDALAYAPDWLTVPDEWTAREYRQLGYPAQRIEVVGHPHYDAALLAKAKLDRVGRARLRARLLPDARERPVLIFVSEISAGLDPDQYSRSSEYTLSGRGRALGRSEIVVEELLDAVSDLFGAGGPRPYLVLRRHPKEIDADLAAYLSAFDLVSRDGDPLELIYAADLVVGMSSMLLMEAFLLEVPTLAVLPRARERDWLPVTRTGAVPCVTERAPLRAELQRLLQPHTNRATAVGAARTIEIKPGAATRIVAFVQQHSTPHFPMTS